MLRLRRCGAATGFSPVACFHPLQAWQRPTGEVVFVERGAIARPLTLPCGQCIGCRLERARQWSVRVMHEASMHDSNYFITLTYDDDHLPSDGSLTYRHFQLFMKKLRKKYAGVRFFMCGEYGERFRRPHYHACMFNLYLPDLVLFSDSRHKLYTSESLSALWPYGFVTVGDVTFESACYVASYTMKKVTGPAAADHYRSVNPFTGEVFDIVPEFVRMSLKPGIGASWIAKYSSDVYPEDHVIVRGTRAKPPRYYDKFLALADSDLSDFIAFTRYTNSFAHAEDTTPERLAVRETVTRARFNLKVRTLE